MHGRLTVLHYVGYDSDNGGIVSVIRALAGADVFSCVLGMNVGGRQRRTPALPVTEFPPVAGEVINLSNFYRARRVAREVSDRLRKDETLIFHGHSRAGLLVVLWLKFFGQRRAVATVHSLGRRRWFYRLAKFVLGKRLVFLSPAMKRYYGLVAVDSKDCLSDCVPESAVRAPTKLPRGEGVVFGCVGTLAQVKQWEVVIAALARIPKTAAVTIKHTGAEDSSSEGVRYADELRALVHQSGETDRWIWCDARADMKAFLGSIDCLIVASPWEASSMAALEAIAAGVPVLAAAESGTRELIERCGGGWTFDSRLNAVANLAATMQKLSSTDELNQWRRNDVGLAEFLSGPVAWKHVRLYASLQ